MKTWFLNLRTGVKLGIAFGAAFLIAILVGVAGGQTVERLFAEADRVSFLSSRGINGLVRIHLTCEALQVGLTRQGLESQDPEKAGNRELSKAERKELGDFVKSIADQAKSLLSEKEKIVQSAQAETGGGGRTLEASDETDEEMKENRDRLANIAASLRGFEEKVAVLESVAAGGGDAAAKPLLAKEVLVPLKDLMKDAKGLEGALHILSTTAAVRMKAIRGLGQQITLGGALAGALLALLVGVITTRMVVRPLREMTAAAHRISEGDLTAEITHESRDEVGGLADSFRSMQASLRDLSAEAQRVAGGDLTRGVRGGGGELGESFARMVESLGALLREIQEAGTQVKSSSSRILGGLQRNAEANREESAATDSVEKSMESLSEAARAIASSSADVERTAGDAASVASQGTASVGSALEGMFRTREKVNEITQKTLVLGEKCRRIGEVLKIIQSVAGEIHLLALNAAIESAASAGEHGKRFTVVAGEVRRLAERTRQSAEEIRSILTEIQDAAEATVASAQEGAREVEAGSTVATSARAALEEVIKRIHETARAAREISRATQDQRQSSERIASSMRDISRAVRRMAEGTEESSRAVQELTQLSERFGDLVGTFRTG